jgi:hypothetical protein
MEERARKFLNSDKWCLADDDLSEEKMLAAKFHEVAAQAESDGVQWMLRAIVASLRGYPSAGGDSEVMAEADRIADQARLEGVKLGYACSLNAIAVHKEAWITLNKLRPADILSARASELGRERE